MNRAADITLLKEKFDKQFPVSTDLCTCLKTVHNSYQLNKIHEGHTDRDGHLEEGLFAIHPVIQHCVKDILAVGKSRSTNIINSSCALRHVGISVSSQKPNSFA